MEPSLLTVSVGDTYYNSNGNLTKIVSINRHDYAHVDISGRTEPIGYPLKNIVRHLKNGTYTKYIPVSDIVPFVGRKLKLVGLSTPQRARVADILHYLGYRHPASNAIEHLRRMMIDTHSSAKGIHIGKYSISGQNEVKYIIHYEKTDIPEITLKELESLINIIDKQDEVNRNTPESRVNNSQGRSIKKTSQKGRIASSSRLAGNRVQDFRIGGRKAERTIKPRDFFI